MFIVVDEIRNIIRYKKILLIGGIITLSSDFFSFSLTQQLQVLH